MKKNLFLLVTLFFGLALISCEDTTTDPLPTTGTIYIESEPSGAEIWLDGVNTGVVTPGTVEAEAGPHIVTLKLEGYGEREINVNVTAGEEVPLAEETIILSKLGSLIVQSEPAGATIILDGVNTGEVTPHTFSLADDNYTIVLQLTDYADSTFITQISNSGTITENIELKPTFLQKFKAKIWETTGTTAAQPSGLILSTGIAQSSTTAEIDIYYYSNTDNEIYIVQSAHESSGSSRETFFKVGSSPELNDGINSSLKDNEWVFNMSDREENYVFLLDADGHYSKLKIVNYGGGSSEAAWVEVEWFYNPKQNDINF